MENKVNNIDFLEELKQDYQLVTKKLESQQINNERLLRTVMKNKMKGTKQFAYVQLLVLFPMLLCAFLYLYFKNFISLPLTIFTIVIGVADILVYFRVNKVIGKGCFEEDLLASRTTLLKMKQLRTKQLLYGIAAIIVWFGLFSYDLYIHLPTAKAVGFMVACLIGGLVGFGSEYAVHRKQQRINDELIKEIDRFKNEEVC